jgi:hypothetical protein
MDDNRYWPFDVLPPDQRTPLHQQQIDFLETAYREGFRPFMFDSESFGASAETRSGHIVHRTRQFWELLVEAPETGRLAAYVAGFDVNAEAVLCWLRGAELVAILEFVRPYLVSAGGRSSGYHLESPTGAKE